MVDVLQAAEFHPQTALIASLEAMLEIAVSGKCAGGRLYAGVEHSTAPFDTRVDDRIGMAAGGRDEVREVACRSEARASEHRTYQRQRRPAQS